MGGAGNPDERTREVAGMPPPPERRAIMLGLTIGFVGFLGNALVPHGWMVYVVLSVSALQGLVFPSILPGDRTRLLLIYPGPPHSSHVPTPRSVARFRMKCAAARSSIAIPSDS